MEKLSEFFGLRFADGALPVKYLGSNPFRAKYFPEVFLSQAARLHQMLECPLWTCFPNWIAPLLVLVNEHGQQFGEFLFFWRRVLTFVETQQLVRETLGFLIRADDMGKRTAQQLPVSLLVEVYTCRDHCFQAPSSYSTKQKSKQKGETCHGV